MTDDLNNTQNNNLEGNNNSCKCHCHNGNDGANHSKEDGGNNHECCHNESNGGEEHSHHECKCKEREAELLAQIDILGAECSKNKDLFLREAASFDNYRRRMQRDMEQLSKFALIPLVEDLIPVLDNLEIAMNNVRQHLDSPAWIEGIEMLAKQIRNVFKKHMVDDINPAKGEEFNPNLEEAVSFIPSDEVPANKVIQVVRTGYRIDDRLIRPASVVVSSGKAEGK